MRSSRALTAASTSSAAVTIPSEAVVWQCGSAINRANPQRRFARPVARSGLEERAQKRFRIEWGDVIDPLPHSRQLHRHAELRLDCDDGATLGAAVQLREDQPGHRNRLVEC